MEGFKSDISYVNSSSELKLKEVLLSLTTPLSDKLSIAFNGVKTFPKLQTKLFAPYFEYITKELIEIDCYFMDDKLQKLLLELQEVIAFTKWIYEFLSTNALNQEVEAVSKSKALRQELKKRLTKSYQRSVLLAQYYCGIIEFYIWNRAKDSVEIVKYLKENMKQTVLNSGKFLIYKKKISFKDYKIYAPFEKQKIIVISNDLQVLKSFKETTEAPFEQWEFFGFSKVAVFDAWMHSYKADKIVIDYDFDSHVCDNGIEFLKLIIKKYPIFQEMVNLHKIYIVANDNQLIDFHNYKNRYNFSIITKPLKVKNISDVFLYG